MRSSRKVKSFRRAGDAEVVEAAVCKTVLTQFKSGHLLHGEVAESGLWHRSRKPKALRGPWVQIPPSPPYYY